jgi:hypothetical protein
VTNNDQRLTIVHDDPHLTVLIEPDGTVLVSLTAALAAKLAGNRDGNRCELVIPPCFAEQEATA